MKKIIFAVMVVALAAVNLSIVLDSEKSAFELTLGKIEALASGENYTCSSCGQEVDYCNCEFGITCDRPDCFGMQCHTSVGFNPFCPCKFTGYQYELCIF